MPETPRFSTAGNMCRDYGQPLPFGKYHADEMLLQSGLVFGLHVINGREHEGLTFVATAGAIKELAIQSDGPLVRLHSACSISEIGDTPAARYFLSETCPPTDIAAIEKQPGGECDCQAQRVAAQARIAQEGGLFFDLAEQEGRGAGIEIKRQAYALQHDEGLDTAQAYERLGQPFDARRYGHCALFLLEHGIKQARLMSNNPRKIEALRAVGIEVTPVPLVVGVTANNIRYLETKRDKDGHLFPPSNELRYS